MGRRLQAEEKEKEEREEREKAEPFLAERRLVALLQQSVHASPHHHLHLLLQPQLPPPSSSPRTPSLLSRPPCWQFQQAHVDGVAVSLASHPAPQPMQPHSATHPTMSHLLQHVDLLLIPQGVPSPGRLLLPKQTSVLLLGN